MESKERAVIFDGLDVYSNKYFSRTEAFETAPKVQDENARVLICRIILSDKDDGCAEVIWAHDLARDTPMIGLIMSKDNLTHLTFTNNLDLLLTYTDKFICPVAVILALLEQIQDQLKPVLTLLPDPETGFTYMDFQKRKK